MKSASHPLQDMKTLAAFTLLAATAYPQAVSQNTNPAPEAQRSAPVAESSTTEPPEDEIVALTPFEVTSTTDRGYQATETLAGTRIRTNLADVGSAISVITKEFMQDVGATDNTTLLQYATNAEVGGVRSTYAGLGNGTTVSEQASLASPSSNNRVRGLSAADNTRDFYVSDIPWDGFNIDRVEVQRGPNSILFGLGKPAGIINASLRNAEFRDRNSTEIRFGSYGSVRGSLDINQELIDNKLAIRLIGLMDHEDFQQQPAFEDDERVYATVRYDPQLFSDRSFKTSIKAKYEHGEIDANRPRSVPPTDHLSPWFRPVAVSGSNPFGGMGKMYLSNGYNAEYESTPPVGGDGRGQTRPADPDYNPWVSGRGNQQQPMYFYDGTSGQLYNIYGGFVNNGAVNADGTPRSPSSSIVGQRYSGVFYGVGGLPNYATQARLPGHQYGQYREQTLRDASVFNFYDNLIDGPTKWENEEWDAYNITISQTGWDDRVGLELAYDRQDYNRANESFLGWAPTLDIDILQNFQDFSANPNVGRPYVQGSGSGSGYESEREYVRASLFAEFRASDVFQKDSFLEKLIGLHRFNGIYSKEKYSTDNRSWLLYANSPAFDAYTGVPTPFNERGPLAMIYLGSSIAGRDSAAGANLSRINAPIVLNDGAMYHFSSQWNATGVAYNDPWTVPANLADAYNFGTDTPMQNSNPANYVGWNSNYNLDILRYRDGDQSLTNNAARSNRTTESWAGSWQAFFWNRALVGTVGWRYDSITGDSGRPLTAARSTLDLTRWNMQQAAPFKEHSLSHGAVLHLNKLFEKDFLPINISLSYNRSSNFEVSDARRDIFGNFIDNPKGKTKDYGVLLSTKDGRYSLRAVKYESSVSNASTQMSGTNVFGNIIVHGLRWRNVFLYDLNAYTLDTANGSNEWRYNFDPDTSIGETQEEATARENASIAAWNEIQAHLPASFYQAWGFTPPSDLANPDPAHVQAYAPDRPPVGLAMTADTLSKGEEYELTANPTPNWRIAFNASRTEATRNNVGSKETVEFVNYMNTMMAGPAGEMRQFSGGATANTMRVNWNSWIGPYTLMKLQEGAAVSELREWRYNLVTNYRFSSGPIKGTGIGGSYRWQDEVVIGYPVLPLTATTYAYDLAKPYYGPSEDALDLWVSYERQLTKKIHWKIQFNVRNVLAEEELIPISVQPDGQTWASVRIAPNREWFVTNTFTF